MANKTVEAWIKCPFYVNERENLIMCEGYITNTCMITKFSSAKEKKAHLKANCYHHTGGGCFMAESLFRKYDKEDNR
ncbi:MAG: hypothetical protein IJS90_05145 [Clostridia bacterium]|nr:hypothetical protein [Clostridia bacterium]